LTSETVELLVVVCREDRRTLGRQVEDHIRESVRSGSLKPGSQLPSTRDLAEQLEISRPIIVDAYAQLASEGFLVLRQGARPRVALNFDSGTTAAPVFESRILPPRFDFRPAIPDLRLFPRKAWLRSARIAAERMQPHELGYDGRHGTDQLRNALAEYLGRVRSVVTSPSGILITSGFAQTQSLFCRTIVGRGGRRLAVEDPSYTNWEFAQSLGLKIVPVPVDEQGIDVNRLTRTSADGVILTPTHQSPTGVVLSGERRTAIIQWLRARDAFALEDDYDAEFRYDRPPVGALQALATDRIVYAGTASKTLAPGLRLGWAVVPPALQEAMLFQHRAADRGASRIDQNALGDFIARGDLDRHLRKVRLIYRKRRDELIAAVQTFIPEASVGGIAAGLHAAVTIPYKLPEKAILAETARRGVAFEFMSSWHQLPNRGSSTLLLGYAQTDSSAIRLGVRLLADTIHVFTPKELRRSVTKRQFDD
jgi:GntR family transcriptional regulator / MocR family aminotransferase